MPLPEGFVLDQAQVPAGFVLDAEPTDQYPKLTKLGVTPQVAEKALPYLQGATRAFDLPLKLGGKVVSNVLNAPGAAMSLLRGETPEQYQPTFGPNQSLLADKYPLNPFNPAAMVQFQRESFPLPELLPMQRGMFGPLPVLPQQPLGVMGQADQFFDRLAEMATPENVSAVLPLVAASRVPALAAHVPKIAQMLGVQFGVPLLAEGVPQELGAGEYGRGLADLLAGGAMTVGAMHVPTEPLPREVSVPSTKMQGGPSFPFAMPDQPRRVFNMPDVEQRKSFETPIIGEQPQPVRQPLPKPFIPEIEPASALTPTPPTTGGEISFRGQGIPSAMQAKEMVPPNRLHSGMSVDPNDLRVAVRVGGRLLIGQRGDSHATLLERNGIDPKTIDHPDPARGFVNVKNPEQFLSRQEAQTASGIQGSAQAGGLDSADLPDAARYNLLRESGMSEKEAQDAISKLRTEGTAQAQAPVDIQKVGEEVRPVPRAGGEARQEGQEVATQRDNPLLGTVRDQLSRIGKTSLQAIKEMKYQPETGDVRVTFSDRALQSGTTFKEFFKRKWEEAGLTVDVVSSDYSKNEHTFLLSRGRPKIIETPKAAAPLTKGQTVEETRKALRRAAQELESAETDAQISEAQERVDRLQRKLDDLEKGGTGKVYSGIPIFDPELWGQSKDVLEKLRGKFAAHLEKQGDKDTAVAIKSASPNQFKARDEREAAILNNPNARPFNRTKQTVNQPGESPTGLDIVRNTIAPVLNIAKQADRLVNPTDVLFDWLDGGKADYKGPLMENIRKAVDDDFNTELGIKALEGDPVRELVKKHKIDQRSSERIDVYLKAIQEGGRERMIASGVSPNIIDNVLKNLTPAEREVANAMREFYDRSYPIIAGVAKRVDKLDVKRVENYSPWYREWRSYKPQADELAVNPALLTDKAKREGVSVDDILWPGLAPEMEGRVIPGSTISRKPKAATPIRLDAIGTFERYLSDYAHYVTFREHLKDMASTVRRDEFRSKYGDLGQELVMDYLNNVARQGRYRRNAILDTLRRLSSRGIIAFRLPSQFVHMANIPLAMQRTGVLWWNQGLHEAMSDRGMDFLHKHFAETYARGGGEPALAEITQQYARSKAGQVYNSVSRAGFYVQRMIDQLNAQATVLGLYFKALEKKGLDPIRYAELPVDKEAIRDARVLARRAVASPIYKDVPPLLWKGGSVSRTFMQFQNTFLDQWSNIRYDLAHAGIAKAIAGNPKLAMQMTLAIGSMFLIETAVKFGYKQTLAAATGDKIKEDDTYWKKLEEEALRRVPGMGQLTTALVYGQSGIPSIDVALQPIREGRKLLKAEDEAAQVSAATRMVGGGLEAAGVPGTSQMLDVATGLQRAHYFKPHTERLRQETGKRVEDMDIGERLVAEMQHKAKQPKLTPKQEARAITSSRLANTRRGEEIQKVLPKADRQWLESRDLRLPGYDNRLTIAGKQVYLTEEETKRYGTYVKEAYSTVLEVLRENYDDLDEETKPKFFSDLLSTARRISRDKIIEEMSVSGNEKDKPKQKRFSVFRPE